MTLEQRAAEFARRAHAEQKRKYTDEPYIVHPMAVVEIVRSVDHTEEMLAAAWLHDVVEDTPVTLTDIASKFGPGVAELVYWLTDQSKQADGNRAARKRIDREHLARATHEAQTIKLADLIDNGRNIAEHDPAFAVTYRREKIALLDIMTGGAPTLRDRARNIMDHAGSFNPTHLNHPDEFKSGTRLIMLKARHKDGIIGRERAMFRQSNSTEGFDDLLAELRILMRPGERIYASASPRDLMRAGRVFGERFMASTFDPPEVRKYFHRRLPYQWYSCLMQLEAADRDAKWWMFDCDDAQTFARVMAFTADMERYAYATKSGNHVLVRPYNRQTTPLDIGQHADMNPLMLWSYT